MTDLLFIHGILGKPDYFDFLRPYIPEECRSTYILLEGHGGSPQDFSKASMSRWRSQVSDAVDTLRKDCDRLLIVAHSMGTLFAIDNAIAGKADALFLLNAPLKIRVTRRLLVTPLKVHFGKINDRQTQAAKDAYSISDDKNIFHYAGWLPRYLELFAEIRRTRRNIGDLNVPTRAYFSTDDEMVSPSSAALLPHNSLIETVMLGNSGHYYYSDTDRATITKDFAEFAASQSARKKQ